MARSRLPRCCRSSRRFVPWWLFTRACSRATWEVARKMRAQAGIQGEENPMDRIRLTCAALLLSLVAVCIGDTTVSTYRPCK
jgi:hypothetical protein